MVGRRRRGRGHRDDLARPGARPRRRDRLRRRDPDQPDPRAPRAARHVGGVPRRQAAAVRAARRGASGRARAKPLGWPADRDRQRRRPVGRRVHRRRPGGRRAGPDLRHGPGGRRPGDPRRGGPRRLRIAYDAPSGRGHRRPPAGRPLQRPQRARGRRARRGGRARSRRRSARASPRSPVVPGRMERVDARPAVRGHRRLRPQPGLARRPSSTCSRRWPRRAAAG